MDILSFVSNYVLLFLLLISLLVFVHEFGHYSVARLLGVKAEVFSIGFGPEIIGWTGRRSGTRWRLSLIPLGGYVKFKGEMLPSEAVETDSVAPELRKSLFHFQPVWGRIAIVAAGPLANLLLAWFLTALMLMHIGQGYTVPQVGVVEPGGPAARAGILAGDMLVSFNGSPISRFEDFEQEVQIRPNATVQIDLRRDGRDLAVELTLDQIQFADRFGNVHRLGKSGLYSPNELPVVGATLAGTPAAVAGLQPGDRIIDVEGTSVQRFSDIPKLLKDRAGRATRFTLLRGERRLEVTMTPDPVPNVDPGSERAAQGRVGIASGHFTNVRQFDVPGAAIAAVRTVARECKAFYTLLRQLALGLRPLDELSGPMRMAKTTGEVAQIGWTAVVSFAILISVLLGLFNLLPIPLLDGGHLLYYAIEWIRGKPLGIRAQEYGFRFGFLIVMSATVLATWNDISQIFGHLWR